MTLSFFLRRFLQALAVLLSLSFVIYILIGLMPGDPIDLMAAGNPHLTPEGLTRLHELHGLDRPLVERYTRWVLQAASGDLGYSRTYGLPVLQVITPRLLATATLMGLALALSVIIAIPLGIAAARKPESTLDLIVSTLCLAGISLPPFWMGLLLITFFSVKLSWLPATALTDQPLSWILPVLTLTTGGIAAYIRHARGAMIEAMKADCIRTARAKGCSEARVIWNHAFRAALPPLVTLFMLDLGALLSGAATVEIVFAYPGMGRLMFDAVMGNDYNLALAGFLILALCVLVANMLADIFYALLDRRAGEKT